MNLAVIISYPPHLVRTVNWYICIPLFAMDDTQGSAHSSRHKLPLLVALAVVLWNRLGPQTQSLAKESSKSLPLVYWQLRM